MSNKSRDFERAVGKLFSAFSDKELIHAYELGLFDLHDTIKIFGTRINKKKGYLNVPLESEEISVGRYLVL